MKTMNIDWEKLTQIKELAAYFDADFSGFQARIQHHIQQLESISSPDLDKLTLLRVLEVTNGCLQWGFRRQDEECLSVEQTRECMRTVIGFIKEKKIDLPTGESIVFTPFLEQLINNGRELYYDAFKRNIPDAEREYYAYSTAQFLLYGIPRVSQATTLVQQHFESLFTDYYIQRGQNYIRPYLEALLPD
ncbi:MAG: hypothetical protein ACOYME_01515 [Prochlorotrichaceae cyanobacterium]